MDGGERGVEGREGWGRIKREEGWRGERDGGKREMEGGEGWRRRQDGGEKMGVERKMGEGRERGWMMGEER